MKYILPFNRFVAVWLGLLLSVQVLAQCPNTYTASFTNASCKGVKDGAITVVVADGATPFYFLAWVFKGGVLTPVMGAKQAVSADGRTVTFSELGGLPPGSSYMISISQEECEDVFTFPINLREPSELTLTVSAKTDVTGCYGDKTGSFTVSSTGGNGGNGQHLYAFENGPYESTKTFSNLAAGTYNVKVKDPKGCITETNVTIAQPTQLTLSLADQTNPLCAGSATGSISVAAAGGTPGYQYVLNGGAPTATATFSNLPAGAYTIEVIDSKGCTATLPAVTLANPPTLTAAVNTKADASCNGVTDGSATVDVSGGTAPYTFSWNTTPAQNTATATNLGAGTYTVTVTDANACTRTANVTIGQPASVAPPAVTNAAICVGIPVPNLSATGAGIKWYNENGDEIATGSAFKPAADQVDNKVAGTYTFYATQTVGSCESPKTAVTLTVHAFPDPPVASSPAPICAGQDIPALSATGTNLTWYDNAATVLGTGSTFTPGLDKSVAGTYTFFVTQTQNNCESSSTAVTLTINPAPAKPAITGTLSFCQGGQTQLTSSAASDNQWLLNGNPIPGATDQTLTVNAAGTYSVRITNADGCTSTADPVTVSQTATPSAPGVADVVYCQEATASALTASGTDLLWYATASGGTGSDTAPEVITSSAGVFEYFVSQTVNGCESPRARLTVTIHAKPALPTITGSNAFCQGGNTLLTSSAASGNQWYKDGVLLSGATNQTLTVTQAGTYSVTVSNANNCSTSSTGFAVTQTTVAAPVISGELSFCEGESTSLSSSAASGNQWLRNGSPLAGETGQTLTVSQAGDYSVSLTQNGCVATSALARVSVTPLPAAPTAAGNGPVCVGSPIELTASTIGGATYAWMGPNNFTSTLQNPTIPNATAAAGGTYSVTVTVNGCTSPAATVDVAINPAFDFTLSSTAPTACGAQDGRITVTPSVAGTYRYRVDNGEFSPSADVLTNLPAGTYTVYLKNDAGCVVQKTHQLVSPGGFTATAAHTNEMACGAEDGTITVTASPASAGYQYALRRPGRTTYDPESNVATFNSLAPGTYQVKVTDGNGCEFVVSATVTEFTCPPVCSLTAQVTGTTQPTCANPTGGAIAVTVNGGTAPYQYSVNPNQPFGSIANLSGLPAGNYVIRVKDAVGCLQTLASVTLTAPDGPAAPTLASIDPVCTGATITLTANSSQANATFQWTGPNGFTATGKEVTIPNATAANGGAYSATVTVNGCVSPAATVSVTVKQAVAAPGVADLTYCTGVQAGAVTATGTNLKWYDAATGGNPSAAAPTPNTTTAGGQDYYVSQTVDGCESPRARIRVTVKPTTDPSCGCNLVVQAVNVVPVKCEGGSDGEVQIFILTGGSGSYQYSKAGGPFQDDPASLVKGLTAGTYTFTVRDKVTGCSVPAQVKVTTEVIVAGLIIASPANTCGGTGSIEFREVSGTGTAPYKVSIDGGANYHEWPAGKLFPDLNPDTYPVAIQDANGCTYQTPVVITGMPKVSVAANVARQPATCSTTDGEVTVSVTGGTGPFQYLLNNEPVTPDASGKIGKLAAGKYTITVRDANQCDATASVSISVDPIEFTVEREEATCEKPLVTARAVVALQAGEKLSDYLFSLDGTTFVPGNAEFANLAPNTYTMYVRRDGLNSCPVSKKFTISGVKGIAYQVSQVNVGCTGAAEGSITVFDIKGGTLNNADAEYGISIDGGVTFQYTDKNTMTFEALKPGRYQVVLAYGTGCRTAVQDVVISSSGIPFDVRTTPATCGSPSGSAEAVVSVTGKKYFYSINNTNFFEAPLFTNLKPGEYKMYIRESANDPCANVLPFLIGGPDSLKAKVRRENCNDIVLSPITGGVRPYRISVDGGNTFVSGNLFTSSYVISNLPDGNYEVVVMDNQDCRTFPVNIRISNTLAAKLKATLSMPDEPTGEIRITDIRGDGPYEVSLNGTDWAMVKDTSMPYDTTITNQPVGEYIVYLRDVNGCVKVYPGEVKESTFLIPNVFTPNGDGVNDTFFIRNLPTGTIVRIVNRWGKVVFESSNYQNDWNGGEYPDGIYYYTVNIAGKGTYSGWVQIWH